MANRRQGGGNNFDGGYNRRPGGQNYGSPFETQSQRPNQQAQYIPRDKAFFGNRQQDGGRNNYGGNQNQGNARNVFDRSDNFGPRGDSNPFSMNSNSRGNDSFGDRGGVTWTTRNDSQRQGSNQNDWSRPQRYEGNSSNSNQNQGMNMNTMGNQSSQPVVMVVPQGNTNGAGLMGVMPMQGGQNPFVQRQQPVQVILGNLPGFNADSLGQQILAAASSRPQFGDMNGPQGGSMNQQNMPRNQQFQQQSQQRFDGNQNNSGQYQNKNNSIQRNSAIRRRSEPVSGLNNKSFNQGNRSATATAALRGNRKRVILRDRFGSIEEVDKKRLRTSAPVGRAAAVKAKLKSLVGKKNLRGTAGGKKTVVKAEAKAKAEADGDKKAEDEAGEKKEDSEDKTDEKKESKFESIPTSLLVCKVCQKSMNDASSYESHLTGRAHVALVKILEERFKKRAELLIFESKISEEEIGIEKERQRRAGKSNQTGKFSKNYCKMCDCNYYGSWPTHKLSIGHRLLKDFLHPNCSFCNSNFVHRVEWVNHLLSAPHLKKLAEMKEKGEDVEEFETTSQDELFVVNIEVGKNEKPTSIFKIRPGNYKVPTKEDLKEMLNSENGKLVLPEGDINVPAEYEEDKAYGEDAILHLNGACCKVCRIYMKSVEEAESHVRSKAHFGKYVAFLKKVIAAREQKKADEEKAAKLAAEKEKAEAEAKAKAEAKAAAAAEDKKDESMEVEGSGNTSPSKASPVKSAEVVEAASPAKSPTKSANADEAEPVTEAKTEEVKTEGNESASNAEAKVEGQADEEMKEEEKKGEAKTETPKKAGSPAKTPQSNRGQQRGRGNRGRGTPGGRGGRGGMQTPQRGVARRGSVTGVRGGRGNRGGMDSPNWRGNRGRGQFR